MTGIHTATVRLQNVKRKLAALELEKPDADARSVFAVIEIQSGSVDAGDEIIGNIDTAGRVDLFNRTKHDHVNATVCLVAATRDEAVAYMSS